MVEFHQQESATNRTNPSSFAFFTLEVHGARGEFWTHCFILWVGALFYVSLYVSLLQVIRQ